MISTIAMFIGIGLPLSMLAFLVIASIIKLERLNKRVALPD